MTFRIDRILGISTLATVLLAGAPARGADDDSGVWWENSMQVQMQGMSMPATVTKTCMPKSGPKEPPRSGDDSDCTYSDVQHHGSRTTWKVVCTGKHPMTGEGEMSGTKDGYSGQMTMHMGQGSKGGDVVMVMSGKQLGGDCDPNATKKQMDALKKQSDDAQAQGKKALSDVCEKSAAEGQLRMFAKVGGQCSSYPGAVAKLREVLGTYAGFTSYEAQAHADASSAQTYQEIMKSDPEEDKGKLCKKAAASSSCDKTPNEVIRFLRKSCPTEMRGIARLCCPGRDYSGKNQLWYDICVDYAKDALGKGGIKGDSKDTGAEDKTAPDSKSSKDQAVDKAKGMLKGLFGK